MKKLMAAVLAGLMLAGLLSGCANTANDDEVEYRWKMALNSTEGDNAYDTGVLFAQKIKELTDGRVQEDLYGGAQLGTTAEVLEGMYAGVADVMCESIGTLATFTPLANIEAMPYMFSSYDHFMNVWYSDLGQEIKDAVGDDAGFKLMGASYRGPRVVCATKELKTIADFKGFKLRPDANNKERIRLEWEERDTDMYLDGYSFSDGTLRFIALTTLLLQSKMPEVIIIDEPELGLHPAAINKLAQLVKQASLKSQIILSTQSTNLVNCFEVEDIIVVDRADNQSVFRHLEREELEKWMDDYELSLSDLWEKNMIGGQL